ncbi:30S ribosomal protein S13 [Patescibacteria group bacterium]|nr:30S ribosomal protein S13 [Patescibacteria group bacterium]
MAWIAGVNIPDNKKIRIALTSVYGIGHVASSRILQEAKIDPEIKAKELKPEELNRIKSIIEKDFKVEGDLRREIILNIRRLKDIGSWRGMRHSKRLPVRGQRSRTNSRTVRGNVRKTVGSGHKAAASPT